MIIREKTALVLLLVPLGQMLQNICEKTGAYYSIWYHIFFLISAGIFMLPKKDEK